MRDLSFFLRLHAFPPLARFPLIHLKPYLPLEVRYLIRPTGEVLLYVSNDPNRQTSYEDLSQFGSNRFWNRLFPSTDGTLRFFVSCPECPENVYSYPMVRAIFIGMLCRRGLACHYLPLYEEIALPQTELDEFLKSIFVLLFILSLLGVGCLGFYDLLTR